LLYPVELFQAKTDVLDGKIGKAQWKELVFAPTLDPLFMVAAVVSLALR